MGSFTGNNLRDQERSQNVLLFFIFTKRKIQNMHIPKIFTQRHLLLVLSQRMKFFTHLKNLYINSAIIITSRKLVRRTESY